MSNQRSAVLNASKGLYAALVLSLVSFGVDPALSATLSINANPVSVNSGAPSPLIWSSSDATSCAASGCEAVRIFNDVNDPCTFTLIEAWASEIEHKKHIEGVVSSGGWNHIAAHLACDPTSSYYKEL